MLSQDADRFRPACQPTTMGPRTFTVSSDPHFFFRDKPAHPQHVNSSQSVPHGI